MQILWKKYSKENFEVNVDECGIEQGIPGFGYKYEVLKSAVVHYITKGEGIFKVDDKGEAEGSGREHPDEWNIT